MMISRRNFLAVAGAAAAAAALTACGGSSASSASTASSAAASTASSAAEGGEKIVKVALTCDTGTIDDESFNQACWTAVSSYMGDDCQYYIPDADASDEVRETKIRQAVNDGADVIVCVGYLYGASLAWAADQYPDVKFIAIDVTQGDIGTDAIPANCYCITFKEEQAGYLAGYAIAKDGKTKLGFLGGMAVPAVIRYGYGFVQGADAAAAELGQNIEINYFYGGQFYGDANITSRMEGWYSNGTQVVFACGGGIYTSAVEAALKNNGYVIGVDVDQNYIGAKGVADGTYAYNPFITSAMKGLTEAVNTALADIEAGSWGDIAGSNGNFGLEDGDYIGLPTDADSWNFESFTTDEYEEVKGKIKSGEITVDNSSDDATKPTVSEFTTVNYIQ
ncbi:BMP family lipoprotein [Faecalibacterium wellingii]|uniref:BMP family ABC transporter substrate-binding protein n=1 Tax=Faecalibacterium wellingii TaxID=2929491 RepID=A0ABU3TXZ8_9FIRM|nr:MULTISPECIES: BMP family ABC transporter substrate-binding protein [Faecalibacterium]MDU8688130.1 BMP family ABC transporter substrate-binding protein [Faecalibacterium prausnitzii]UQK55766.1 BMP family ABC transporter substrate-binding protein [Faecalibacterium sp. HTF-F]